MFNYNCYVDRESYLVIIAPIFASFFQLGLGIKHGQFGILLLDEIFLGFLLQTQQKVETGLAVLQADSVLQLKLLSEFDQSAKFAVHILDIELLIGQSDFSMDS